MSFTGDIQEWALTHSLVQCNISKTHQSDSVKLNLSWKHSQCNIAWGSVTRDITEPCFEREIKPSYEPSYGSISTATPTFWKQKNPYMAVELYLTVSVPSRSWQKHRGKSAALKSAEDERLLWSPFPGETKVNTALEDSSKRLIKGKVSQMSQRSRFCRSPLACQKGLAACKCPCSPWVFPSPPDAPRLLHVKIGHSKKQLCSFAVCSSLLSDWLSSRLITLAF